MSSFTPQDDLAQIRSMMERSVKFLSLSPWAAVMAGVYALLGALFAKQYLYDLSRMPLEDEYSFAVLLPVAGIALAVLVLAAATAFGLSHRKARFAGQPFWTPAARRVLANFTVPMLMGGAFVVILYLKGHYPLLAAVMLLFYGVSLFCAGNFTFSDVRMLGVLEMLTGLMAAFLPEKGLLLWAFGFGVLHLVYGGILYWKYERNQAASR
ncbi:MAG: hypothetical protein RL181_1224 [Bacteroidota bacterium]|jgi:hypothetical protein